MREPIPECSPDLRLPSFGGLVGVARRDITPPAGIYARSWGAAAHDVAEGVHRPLTLTCVTFQADSNAPPLVLIGADLGWWKNPDDERSVRSGVLEALSLDEARLLFCLSHTHSGPSLSSEDAAQPGGGHVAPYLARLREAAASAAREALAAAAPATLSWRYGRCDLATDRDLRDPARDRYLVGFNAARPADDTLLVGRVSDPGGRTVGTLVNYACHPTTLAWENRLISPDYAGALRQTVEDATGAPCLFLQGASGDLSPAEQYSGDPALADRHGRHLGHAVLAVLEGMLPPGSRLVLSGAVESGTALALWRPRPDRSGAALACEKVEVELPLKPMPSLAEIEAEWRRAEDQVTRERLWRKRGVRRTVGEGTAARRGLWCWRLGDALLFGHPHEAYSVFQTELRRRFPGAAVAAMNIANGYGGYLPPRALYDREVYPVVITPFAAGSLEILIDEAIAAGERLLAAPETPDRAGGHAGSG